MKLWDKGTKLNKKIEDFTTGEDRKLDVFLAPWDVLGSIAHIKMLASIGLLEKSELEKLETELKVIWKEVQHPGFELEEGIEDIHSQVELMLTRKLGDIGKKIHSGRSRNDQVLVDLKLYMANEIEEISLLSMKLFEVLQKKSEENKEVLMPGYTHMQVAMPSSFGLWFGAYAESLAEDMLLVKAAWDMADQNPLGSAAGYGSSFPLNRKMTTELLGFSQMAYNVVNAQMGRGKLEKFISYAVAGIASTLAKMSMDICMFNGQDFGFFKLPDEFTTGSSIMPHKKNPDVFELIRGRCNKLQSLPVSLSQVLINLPSGYHRDLQVIKEEIIPGIRSLKECLELFQYAISKIEVKKNLLQQAKYELLFTVEEVNQKVLEGIPFRDAYKAVGLAVESGNYQAKRSVNHSHEGSIGNLCTAEIGKKFSGVYDSMNFECRRKALNELIK